MSIFKFVYFGKFGTILLWLISFLLAITLMKTGMSMQRANEISKSNSNTDVIEEVYEDSEKEPL